MNEDERAKMVGLIAQLREREEECVKLLAERDDLRRALHRHHVASEPECVHCGGRA